ADHQHIRKLLRQSRRLKWNQITSLRNRLYHSIHMLLDMLKLCRITWPMLALTLLSCGGAAPQPPKLKLQRITRDVDHPVYLTHDGTKRLFVVEQKGRIRLMIDGQVRRD